MSVKDLTRTGTLPSWAQNPGSFPEPTLRSGLEMGTGARPAASCQRPLSGSHFFPPKICELLETFRLLSSFEILRAEPPRIQEIAQQKALRSKIIGNIRMASDK